MSLAEEMLASISVDDGIQTYSAEEEHIVVNDMRQIIVPNSLKTIAVTKDKDVQSITFDCVRYWDGNDLSTFAIYLNYVLPDLTAGTYIPEAITTSDGDNFYHFDWNIKNAITQKSGKISFAITAIKTKQNDEGETVVDKQWSSLPTTDCTIAVGLDISNVPDDEESADILAQMSAILEQIHYNVDEWLDTVVVQSTGTSKTKVMSQEAVTVALDNYKSDSINQSKQYTNSIASQLDEKNSRNSKRITNLEQGITPDPFETDSGVAYIKDVPSNALPYAEVSKVGGMTHKDGNTLKHAKVTEMESVGANLIPYPYAETTKTLNGITFTDNGDGSITVNGTSTGVATFDFSTDRTLFKAGRTYTISGTVGDVVVDALFSGVAWGGRGTFTVTEAMMNAPNISTQIRINSGITLNNVTVIPMLNEGSTALPYSPYARNSLPIPEAVQAIDGYGWGINADCYNYIDWEKKQFVKRVGVVDLGTLNWDYSDYWSTRDLRNTVLIDYNNPPLLAENYETHAWQGKAEGHITMNGTGHIVVPSSSSAIRPTGMLYYELATPIVTDISKHLTADNYIRVEGGGTITAVNMDAVAVPTEITYMLRG